MYYLLVLTIPDETLLLGSSDMCLIYHMCECDIFYSQKMSESCFRTNTGSLYHHPLEKLRIGNAE